MITQKDGYILFDIRIVPRSSINKLEKNGENLRLKITSAPVEGEANKALILFLSRFLSLPQKSISIERGLSSRNKLIRADGITKEQFISITMIEK